MKNAKLEYEYLALIFKQGGTLKAMMYCNKKENVETYMRLFYDFPFYCEYIPLKTILPVEQMLAIHNEEEVMKSDMTDVLVTLEAKHDRQGETILKTVHVSDKEVYDEEGDEFKLGGELSVFTAWNDLFNCRDCDGEGSVEHGPTCWKPASSCCGGCYESVMCETCDGAGTI